MSYKIEIDVLSAVQDFYPGLPAFQAELIAESIVNKWDYSQIYDSINDDIKWYADSHDIELEGKDGVTEESDNVYVLNPPPSRLFPND